MTYKGNEQMLSRFCRYALLALTCTAFGVVGMFSTAMFAQTAATGALTGTVTDPSGAVVSGAIVNVTSASTGVARSVVTKADGTYIVPLLPVGSYSIEISATGFKKVLHSAVPVNVTETTRLSVQLQVGAASQSVIVSGNGARLQTESVSLGQVVDRKEVVALPLVTRNFTQIIALSPGVTSDANDANQLGRGTGGEEPEFGSHGGTFAHGIPSNDNNFQMNGVPVDDVQETGTYSGGIAIPNPDTIEEFRVQTGQYDATFGNGAGANVDLITRGGTNHLHGTLFEFFRNEDLNANDYFANQHGQSRPVLRQNQFGGTLGGPVVRNKLFYFGSYQGTRQTNGIAFGCSLSVISPPFTNDRSAAALGTLFGGQSGVFGGVAVAPDGSNINPVALALFQKKLPNGQYFIPTPQKVVNGVGSSFLTTPCTFNEDQYMANGDYDVSAKSTISGRFFQAKSIQSEPFTFGAISPLPAVNDQTFRNLSLAHTYVFGPNAVNEFRFGYHRTYSNTATATAFTLSSIGITAPPQVDPQAEFFLPGLALDTGALPVTYSQDHLVFEDIFSLNKGKHAFRFGGGTERTALNQVFNEGGELDFLSYPDFLLGQSAAQNGSFFSNVFYSLAFLGDNQRDWRIWDRWAFAQDDIKLAEKLTVNLGLRYEKIGEFYDNLGRNANLDPALLNPNPPATGTLAGYTVPSNYSGPPIPSGVTKIGNGFGIPGVGQNKISPRVGFAWQASSHSVVHGGYGIFYSRPNGQVLLQLSLTLPYGYDPFVLGLESPITLQHPFLPPLLAPSNFPLFIPYSPRTQNSGFSLAQSYQPTMVQEYNLNVQTAFAKDWLMEVGYVGTKLTHLPDTHSINQANLASPGHPIRGQTTNTLSNIPLRVPHQGFTSSSMYTIDSSAYGYYNGLEASLSKRFSHGLQFLASYTFSKDTASNGAAAIESGQGLSDVGNQNDPRARYGPTDYNRPNRFVISALYQFPALHAGPAAGRELLNGWSLSGVGLFQSGQSMTITGSNGNNIFGITADRAQFAPGCSASSLLTPGGVRKKLNNYFNNSCIDGLTTTPRGTPLWAPLDGGTNFGNTGVGIVEGPGQHNVDLAFVKENKLRWPNDGNLEFRVELFNAFNSTQFANPDTNASDGVGFFGTITSTAVNNRIMQLALKLQF